MLKRTKRSRTVKGRKKSRTPAKNVTNAEGMACVMWTANDINPSNKITGFFHHISLDHNYVFSSPISVTGLNIPGSQNTAISHGNIDGTGISLCISKNGVHQPTKRPALKPAKKSQKTAVSSNDKAITDYFPVRRSFRKTLVKMKKEKLKDIEEAIISGNEDGYEVRNFDGKGRGVIATKPLKQGDFVLEYYGDLITREEAKIREYLYSRDENVGCYMYYFTYNNKAFCVDATRETGRLGRLVNHCKKGNLGTKIFLIKETPHLILVANQDIKSGQELCYDYGDRSKKSLEFHPWLAS